MSPFFKDNNVHKFPTHQPPLKTSGPPFSATSAPFLRFLSSPLAPWSAQNGENPRVCFPFPEPTHPLSEPDKTHPVTTYRFLAFRKKKGGTEFTAGILVHGGAAFLKRFPGISVTPTTTVPRRFRWPRRSPLPFWIKKSLFCALVVSLHRNRPNFSLLFTVLFFRRSAEGNKDCLVVKLYRDASCAQWFTGRTWLLAVLEN